MKKAFIMIIVILWSAMIGEMRMTALLASLLVVGTLTEHFLSDRARKAVKDPTSFFRSAFRRVRIRSCGEGLNGSA